MDLFLTLYTFQLLLPLLVSALLHFLSIVRWTVHGCLQLDCGPVKWTKQLWCESTWRPNGFGKLELALLCYLKCFLWFFHNIKQSKAENFGLSGFLIHRLHQILQLQQTNRIIWLFFWLILSWFICSKTVFGFIQLQKNLSRSSATLESSCYMSLQHRNVVAGRSHIRKSWDLIFLTFSGVHSSR